MKFKLTVTLKKFTTSQESCPFFFPKRERERESDFATANNYNFTVLACSIRLLCFSFFFVYIHDDSESTAFLDQLPTALFCKTSFCIIHAMVKVDKR